jgi:hypothetical protein
MIKVIPSYLIWCKTVVSTTVVRTQGLGADHKSRKGVDWVVVVVVVMAVVHVQSGRTQTCRSGPYLSTLQVPISVSAPSLVPMMIGGISCG